MLHFHLILLSFNFFYFIHEKKMKGLKAYDLVMLS